MEKETMKTYTYDTEYGELIVKTDGRDGEVVENTLDADAILGSEEAQNLTFAHGIWGHIIEELFGEDEIHKLCPPRPRKSEFWAGNLTDYGFFAIFASGLTFTIDHQQAYFNDSNVQG